ncbi:succinyl-diaminopimelate desuccinylase [Glaciecola sp.]|jgi:succinyl-diaminopimelate desuccinylase|nr:succinyl-diaminopimelate desuccinylase [Glaciecola sp.]
MNDVIALCQALIQEPSVTPEDKACQPMMADRLIPLGFGIETMVFHDTTNMWARKGTQAPLFCFAGHTDVVPTGPADKWQHPPFAAQIHDGYIWGRGAADMKGSLAAMVVATEQFVADYPNHKGSIAYLITSDEEGPFINGTTKVIDTLEARNEKIDYCVVGEPSSTTLVGDVVKYGRRGSLTGDLIVKGKQGHVAYPHLADNPIHNVAAPIDELSKTKWDDGNSAFPASTFQVSNFNAGTGAGNVIPGECRICFNFRFCTEQTFESLQQQVYQILDRYKLDYTIDWTFNGLPFLTESGTLVDATVAAIKHVTGRDTELSTAGGTSDGRFIAPTGAQVIELGPINATIHQIDERVKADDLVQLADMYYHILVNTLGNQ